MKTPRLTIMRQISIGYLVMVLFSLGAVGYSLKVLSRQNTVAQQLIHVDMRIQNLARQLRGTILTQGQLETQALSLRQNNAFTLFSENSLALSRQVRGLIFLLDQAQLGEEFRASWQHVDNHYEQLKTALRTGDWTGVENLSRTDFEPARQKLLHDLDGLITASTQRVDQNLGALTAQSGKAFRIVLTLIILGMVLAALVAVSVGTTIRRSLHHFAEAIRAIGAGTFEHDMPKRGNDEFTALALEFQDMGRKLRELEQQRLDANPLTLLPGNRAIEREIEARVAAGELFAHGFADLDHFKAYNDRYGYRKGSEVISRTGEIVSKAVKEFGGPKSMVGHVGGDDYIFLVDIDHAEAICQAIIDRFDAVVPEFYSPEDRQAGHFVARDRYGQERSFPLLSISIAVVSSDRFEHPSGQALGRECARIKEHLKQLAGSRYLIDRRRGT